MNNWHNNLPMQCTTEHNKQMNIQYTWICNSQWQNTISISFFKPCLIYQLV